jgi:alkylation response protein AidB-like acyl-CoA dehydrogenase
MQSAPTDFLQKADQVAASVVAANAATTDQEGRFPAGCMEALGAEGLLGLISSTDVGGMGLGPGAAALVVERIGRECASTGMVLTMHYAGTAVLEQHAPAAVRREAAAGRHLSTLAFSETGSRSHFWAPVSTARRAGERIRLDAKKSWVTTAGNASAYVWSSRPLEAQGPSTLWLVPRATAGLSMPERFDGLGLRGNDSRPVTAENVLVGEEARLGSDGGGFDIMMGIVLPYFNLMSAGLSVGMMEAATRRTAEHASGMRYAHLDSSLADLPTVRAYVARMRMKADMVRSLLLETIEAVESGRADAMLRVLEVKAAAGETALEVLGLGMRVCGGAAFRREGGLERYFRDAQAANVMAPTTDQLYDFIGKAVCGLPLFG